MTDFDTIEQRLRVTFRAVAEQPIAPVGVADEPWHAGVAPAPTHRRSRVLLGAVAGVVVIALVGIGVAYGPRSATTTTSPPPSSSYAHVMHAVFAPVSPTSRAGLDLAAATMTTRLRSLGDRDTVTVRGGSIDVSGPSISQSQLLSVASPGAFSVRPVLCGAPTYVPAQPGIAVVAPGSTLPACGAPYALTASNLDVNTTTGQPATTIPADPSFARIPSTPAQLDEPAAAVLLPADPSAGAQEYPRFVLGPAELNGSDIASANAQFDTSIDAELITVALKPAAAAQWDIVAEMNFHQYLGLDLDGQVLSAPLIQPNATTFSSFRGQMDISGNFSVAEAKSLAAVLDSGPLATGLKLESVSRAAVL